MESILGLSLPFKDPILIFGICMVVILATPLLFERLRLPGLIGPIVAGVVLGSSVLNILERGQAIELLGNVGLLYIMFLSGLEINMSQFRKNRDRSLVFGLITFTIPQVLGTIIFRYLLGFDWAASILIASMFASHTLVPYPIISRLGIMKNDAVVTTVGGTILTDTVALLVLVVVARGYEGELTTTFWITLALSMIIYIAAVIYLLPLLARWFFRNVSDGGKSEFIFVLAVVFILSYLARAVGTEAILGAFLVGLTLNGLIPERSRLMNRIQFFGETFIIPFFLIFIGLLVDVSVLASGFTAWIVMISMLSTNVITKWIAANITRRIYNYSNAEGWVIFGLSTCEAAATLAATLVGYELGIIGDDVLNGVVLMIFATCILGPSIVNRFGREVARQQEEQPYEPGKAPQRILVPLANPSTSEILVNIAAMLRENKSEETVFPLTVVAEETDSENTEVNVAAAERLLAHAVVHAAEIDLPVNPVTRVARNPASGIVEAATERRVSDIVIGWNGASSPQQRIFGTVIDQMLEKSTQQVWVCKINHPVNTFQCLIVVLPTLIDHNPGFYEAVRSLKHLASQLGASLQVLVVNDQADRLQQHFNEVAIEVTTSFMQVATWQELRSYLQKTSNDTNLIILVSAREGTVAHERALEHLPQMLADLQSSFLVLYPSEKEARSFGAFQPQYLPDILTEERVLLNLNTLSYEQTVNALLSTAIDQQDPRHNRVLKALVYDDVGYASEILPGVIISHARVQELKETKMFLGIHPQGVRHERAAQPVHVVVLLLSPAQRTTQDHLAQLAEVAQYFGHVENLDQLIACDNTLQVQDWFERQKTM
ncbi:transporter, CPA2 family [Stanieria cyanosphaera PCC 7437]|uniref:Transporter, CPA2 family n=1 Tax=Stanieria cyanosphaera (strain ATCC 29371 / PCC 7437) TaxID=111780 RepID=K9XW58_STAC7|nr:cation:proton antiporter [Stanieria cyanosphaera]AFZ36304.1 transporter, CPA2 family [Stanieria cyanosphaera PCC 7437]